MFSSQVIVYDVISWQAVGWTLDFILSWGKGNNSVCLLLGVSSGELLLGVWVCESVLMSVTVTIVPVPVGTMNKTQLREPSVEEDSGLVAGIVIAVVTVVLILAALVSE